LTVVSVLGEIVFGKLINLHAHDSLVDRDVFNQVQRMTVRAGRKTKSERLLARQGVLRCGVCGARMCASRNKTGYAFYRCTGVHENGQTIDAAIVEGLVTEALRKALSDAKGRASMGG
jgi:hypothetical protein